MHGQYHVGVNQTDSKLWKRGMLCEWKGGAGFIFPCVERVMTRVERGDVVEIRERRSTVQDGSMGQKRIFIDHT